MRTEQNPAKWLAVIMEIALLGVTITENLSVVWLVLPGRASLAGYGCLAAAEGGLILWTMLFVFAKNGQAQRAILLTMMGVDFLGTSTITTYGMFLQAGEKGVIGKPGEQMMIIIILVIAFLLMSNFGAVILYFINDLVKLLKQAENDAKMTVYAGQVAGVTGAAPQLVAELAPLLTEYWRVNMRSEILSKVVQPAQGFAYPTPAQLPTATAQVLPPEKPAQPAYDLDALLLAAGMTRSTAAKTLTGYGITTAKAAYDGLKRFGKLPAGMTYQQFKPLYDQLVGTSAADGAADNDEVFQPGRGQS